MIRGWNFLKDFFINVNVIKWKSDNPVSITEVLWMLRKFLDIQTNYHYNKIQLKRKYLNLMSWIQLFIRLNLFSFIMLKTSTMQNKQTIFFYWKKNEALQKVVSAITCVKNQYQIRSKEMPCCNVWIADPWTSNWSDERVEK